MTVKPERATRPMLYSLVMVVLACLATGTSAAVYANHVGQESNQKWCNLVTTLDDAYKATPPATVTGRRVADQINQLRVDFGCP